MNDTAVELQIEQITLFYFSYYINKITLHYMLDYSTVSYSVVSYCIMSRIMLFDLVLCYVMLRSVILYICIVRAL